MSDQETFAPGRTAVDELIDLVRLGFSTGNLKQSRAFLRLVGSRFGESFPADPATQVLLVQWLLETIVNQQCQVAYNRREAVGRNQAAKEESCQAAAAAELLGISNEALFVGTADFRDRQRENKWRDLASKPENSSSLDQRRFRASIWLGNASSRSGERYERVCMEALVEVIDIYLAQEPNRASLISKVSSSASTTAAFYRARRIENPPNVPAGFTDTGDNDVEPLRIKVPSRGYVRRRSIEESFKKLVSAGHKRIALVGFAGIGKTSLANELTNGSPIIKFQDDKPSITHLGAALRQYRPQETIAVTDDTAWGHLGTLLAAEPAPEYIVLDGLRNTNQLDGIVPANHVSTIVATCRESYGWATPSWQVIDVGFMEADESSQLARTLLPSISKKQAKYIAATSAGYPLMIHAICGLVTIADVQIEELCDSITAQPGDIRTTTDERLSEILSRIIDSLRKQDPFIVELLACAISNDVLTAGTSLEALRFFAHEHHKIETAKFVSMVHTIRSVFLIELHQNFRNVAFARNGRGSPPRFVHVHPVFRSVLRDLLIDDVIRFDTELYGCLERFMSKIDRFSQSGTEFDRSIKLRELCVPFLHLHELIVRTSSPLIIPGKELERIERNKFLRLFLRNAAVDNTTRMLIKHLQPTVHLSGRS